MLKTPNLERIERQVLLLISILLVVALYLNLGIYPLTLEEPRRGLIALEMLFSENWLVPTQNGELYFRKPPVYNWLLIFSYKIFGAYSELATRFFSVASFILMAVVFFRFCKRHINERFAAYSTLFFLVSADILFYFSALGEIDLFYSLITLLVFVVIYNFGEKKQYYALFLWAYFLSAIGFLTKGLPSIPFLVISLLAYFIYKKNFKKLISLPHFLGISLFIGLVGGYFWAYSAFEDPSGWWTTLTSESTDRTTDTGLVDLLKHLVAFPIDTVKNILPAGFFLPLLFRKNMISTIKKQPFVLYLTIIFAANILIYWFSTGAQSRYVYALYPPIIGIITYFILNSDLKWRDRLIKIVAIAVAIITLLANLALNFIPDLEIVSYLLLKSVILVLITLVILRVILKRTELRLAMIIACFVLLRYDFSFIMPVSRALTSDAAIDKSIAMDINEITEGVAVYIYDDTQISRSTTFYVEANKEAVLTRKFVLSKGDFWICSPEDINNQDVEVFKIFKYHDSEVFLVK